MKTQDWLKNYDAEIGLWWATKAPAHTAPLAHLGMKVHPGPDAVSRLILAAEWGELSKLPVETVLGTLAKMKSVDNPGHLCWYWEDGNKSSDANASFFSGIGLIALWLGYREELSETSRQMLLAIFEPLYDWFLPIVREDLSHCLNGYMGETTCAWLLAEILERKEDREDMAEHFLRAAGDWLGNGFGIGEHISDVYSRVALQQVSLLLLFARELPPEVRKRYDEVFRALLKTNDAFDGKPYVPTIRCYDFLESPSNGKNRHFISTTYRDRIAPSGEVDETEIGNNPPLEGVLFNAGWHDLAPAREVSTGEVEIPCAGNNIARAFLTEDFRLGSLSRFPLMPEVEFKEWGMSWQSFPIAFWRPEGDWGYLQWEYGEADGAFCHPSEGPSSDPLKRGNPHSKVFPPIVGKTFVVQRGGDLIALRILPMFDSRWSGVKDRFRLVDHNAEVVDEKSGGGWSQIRLRYPERCVSVHHVNLMPEGPAPTLITKKPNAMDWECTWPADQINRTLLNVWAISANGTIDASPRLEAVRPDSSTTRFPEEYPSLLQWDWGWTHWKLKIDPLSATPLVELA